MDNKFLNIIKSKNIVIPMYILQDYKKLNIDAQELLFLMYLYNMGNKIVFDIERYGIELNIGTNEVLQYISSLQEKQLIKIETYENDKKIIEEVINQEGFYSKLNLIMIGKYSDNKDNTKSNIYDIIEKEFGRTLSPMEFEIIKAWLDSGTKEELIKEALKEARFNGVCNLRYIDKIVYEWNKNGIKTIEDVENNRKNFKKKKQVKEVDIEALEWNWFDDEER